ncbi:glycine zipper 2TM domain-containing protein [Arenicella xantha]|uniref:Uncharacterized protein YcfJ n=1 Tax=Arenicella xantha TaxID=644221 RepID=A0A395JJ84_9GAMM|nr:hypothetical protein [Arenicella xantha]RBP50846.1 uncharacterized protein YcfJ [Arenicella xantha]
MKLNTKKARISVTRSVIAATVAGLIAAPVSAKQGYDNYSGELYDYATVVDVSPIVETYQVSNPVEQCWDERVPVRYQSNGYKQPRAKASKTPEILGAIIGGVIANQVGKRGGGKARDVATVAGAVLGGSIARDIKHDNNNRYRGGQAGRYESVRYETVQRCEVKESFVTREQVVAYDVAYKYRGSVFHTQMGHHPGDKIKLKIAIDPV